MKKNNSCERERESFFFFNLSDGHTSNNSMNKNRDQIVQS